MLVKPGFSAVGVALFTVFYGFSGAYSWLRRPGNGFGLMIAGAGFICGAGALLVADARTFTVGRVVMATLVVFMAYVMLCCPSGQLRAPAERAVLGIFIAVTIAAWVAALLASTRLPAAGALYDCFGRCPGNAARVANVSGESGRVVNYIVDGVSVAGLIAVCAVLIGRLLSPSKVQRRTLGPMIACVVVWSAAASAYIFLHEAGATGGTGVLRALVAVSALGIPVAMVIGQWRGRLFVAYGLVDFATELGAAPLSSAVVEKLMRKAVGDPALQLLLWRREHDSYVDVHGAPAAPPRARGVRVLTIPAAGGGPYAAVSFDVHLTDSDALVEGLAKMSLLVLDNERLAVELADSRARIAREGAAERLRLERDLHDGAQQRLLLLKLALADLREEVDDGLGPKLDAAMAEADEAIDEIRRLGHGIYPPALIDLGLGHRATRRRKYRQVDARGRIRCLPRRARGAPECVQARRPPRRHPGHALGERRRSDVLGRRRRLRLPARSAGARLERHRQHDRPDRVGRRARVDHDRARCRHQGARGCPRGLRGERKVSVAALRVVVAEDELLVREGIERILEGIGADVVGTAADLPGLENAVAQLRPEVVVTDIRLPPTYTDEGVRFAVKLRETAPEIGVLVLSKHVDPAYATAVFGGDGRRRGYMLKQRIADRATFEEALAAVALGGSYLDVKLVGDLLDANQRRRDPGLERLTAGAADPRPDGGGEEQRCNRQGARRDDARGRAPCRLDLREARPSRPDRHEPPCAGSARLPGRAPRARIRALSLSARPGGPPPAGSRAARPALAGRRRSSAPGPRSRRPAGC